MQGTSYVNNDALDWQSAVDYCENLNYAGYDHWRLPNIQELRSIVKYDTYNPAIDKTCLNINPTTIGQLLPMRAIQTMRGLSVSIMAMITGTLSLITVMLGVCEDRNRWII